MRIAFRADASATIGGGHVMRCLTLADRCRALGHDVLFLVNAEAASTSAALRVCGHARQVVRAGPCAAMAGLRAHWPAGADLIILDHYGLHREDETAFRLAARHVLVIADHAGRHHDCDILLDTAPGRVTTEYAGCVPPGARMLLGTAYALLHADVASFRDRALARRDGRPVERILIAFGLSDPQQIAAFVTAAVLAAGLPARVHVAIAAGAASLPALTTLARQHETLVVHEGRSALADLMCDADVAIGAAGTSAWERCCLSLPSIVIPLADNQTDNIAALTAAGAALSAPRDEPAAVVAALRTLMTDRDLRIGVARRAAALVDGQGTARVARAIAGLRDG